MFGWAYFINFEREKNSVSLWSSLLLKHDRENFVYSSYDYRKLLFSGKKISYNIVVITWKICFNLFYR